MAHGQKLRDAHEGGSDAFVPSRSGQRSLLNHPGTRPPGLMCGMRPGDRQRRRDRPLVGTRLQLRGRGLAELVRERVAARAGVRAAAPVVTEWLGGGNMVLWLSA